MREEFFRRRRVLKACPRAFRGRFRHAQRIALEAIDAADRQADPIALERGWKLFGLLPTMLLHYPVGSRGVEPAQLESRFESFARGAWEQLVLTSQQSANVAAFRGALSASEEAQARQEAACAKIRQEECSKARQILTNNSSAPGNATTLEQLRENRRLQRAPEAVAARRKSLRARSPSWH